MRGFWERFATQGFGEDLERDVQGGVREIARKGLYVKHRNISVTKGLRVLYSSSQPLTVFLFASPSISMIFIVCRNAAASHWPPM